MTENGAVRGIEAADPRITAFRGIPFAAPPTGENRWRAPQPAESWDGTLDCARFAPISMQARPSAGEGLYDREWHVDTGIAMSEDCLYLNIWTNAKRADEGLPVFVWFFGGGLQCGYTAEMEFDGERIARRGIVVVTVNYRVNVFGYFAHPELTAEAPDAPSNFGSLDQRAGILWVRRNIAAFGGDPDNITIGGQSAGGGSVMSQLAAPGSEGLFRRAIVESALIRSPYRPGGISTPMPLDAAEKNGADFFRFLGVSSLSEARALDAEFVLQKYFEFTKNHPTFFTVEDGKFNVGDPMTLFALGKCVPVDMMAGNTADEFPAFLSGSSREEAARAVFGSRADEFLAFPETQNTDDRGRFAFVNGIECNIKALFERAEENGDAHRRYYYRFDVPMPGWDDPGSFHSSDLWFFFETLAKCWRPLRGKYYDLARVMCNYWCSFIRTGDPNGDDFDGSAMPRWEAYTKSSPVGVVFTPDGVKSAAPSDGLMRFLIDFTKENP